MIGGFEQAVKGALYRSSRHHLISAVNTQQDRLLWKGCCPRLHPKPVDHVTVAAPDLHQRSATVRIKRIAQIMRKRIDIDSGLIASFGNLSLLLSAPGLDNTSRLIVGATLKLPKIGLKICSCIWRQPCRSHDRPVMTLGNRKTFPTATSAYDLRLVYAQHTFHRISPALVRTIRVA